VPRLSALYLLSALACGVPALALAEPVPIDSLAGIWASVADPRWTITIFVSKDGIVGVRAIDRFEATGFYDGRELVAVTRSIMGGPSLPLGGLRIRPRSARELEVRIARDLEGNGEKIEIWKLQPMGGIRGARPDSVPEVRTDSLPAAGDYVYVDELPEPIFKVQPAYPKEAVKEQTEGTVMLQVLVGRDGLVKNVKVIRSIPDLDIYAIAAVKEWRFKPARAKGEPVAVWVVIPGSFKLK